jgi:hypothetical protein
LATSQSPGAQGHDPHCAHRLLNGPAKTPDRPGLHEAAHRLVGRAALVSDVYAGPTSRFDLGNALVVDLLTGSLENVTDLSNCICNSARL